ncbi:MAG: hypothetical protein PHD43_00535 [Methylococcales bacterium]|nr:hypothetical protein [Methylococcales bacterium]
MIEDYDYIYKDRKTIAILMVLGFLLGIFIGYITADVKVQEFGFNASNFMATSDSNRLQDNQYKK